MCMHIPSAPRMSARQASAMDVRSISAAMLAVASSYTLLANSCQQVSRCQIAHRTHNKHYGLGLMQAGPNTDRNIGEEKIKKEGGGREKKKDRARLKLERGRTRARARQNKTEKERERGDERVREGEKETK